MFNLERILKADISASTQTRFHKYSISIYNLYLGKKLISYKPLLYMYVYFDMEMSQWGFLTKECFQNDAC